jgi:predicted DNA-binding protein
MSGAPISLRLPDRMNHILEMLANELHTTKSKLIKDAIAERIEDYLDTKTIDEIVARNEPTISHEELKRELGL